MIRKNTLALLTFLVICMLIKYIDVAITYHEHKLSEVMTLLEKEKFENYRLRQSIISGLDREENVRCQE